MKGVVEQRPYGFALERLRVRVGVTDGEIGGSVEV